MTPTERNMIRAEAAMRILAALYTHRVTPSIAPRNESEAAQKERTRQQDIRRMEEALNAVNAADALLAELTLREEAGASPYDGAPHWPIHDGLPGEGGMPDGHIPVVRPGERAPLGSNVLTCTHGLSSLEDCPACDAADAAETAGKNRENGEYGQS